jgi:hypothetical protein
VLEALEVVLALIPQQQEEQAVAVAVVVQLKKQHF